MRHSLTFALIILSSRIALAQTYSIATIAGSDVIRDGIPATQAYLRSATASRVDGKGNIYVLDREDGRVRKIDSNGIITTVVGIGAVYDTSQQTSLDGPGVSTALYSPTDLAVDRPGTTLYVLDSGYVRMMSLATGLITTITIGSDYFSDGRGAIALDGAGNLYVANGSGVWKIDRTTQKTARFAGNGTFKTSGDGGLAIAAGLGTGVSSIAADNNYLYIADIGQHVIRRIDLGTNLITTFAGLACAVSCESTGDGGPLLKATFAGPTYLNTDASGNLLVSDQGFSGQPLKVRRIAFGASTVTNVATVPMLSDGKAVFSGQNEYLLVGGTSVAMLANGDLRVIAGLSVQDGRTALESTFSHPNGAAVTSSGDLFIADNSLLRKVAADTGLVSTLVSDVIKVANGPSNSVVATGANSVYRIGPSGVVRISGPVDPAKINRANGICVDSKGNVYFTDVWIGNSTTVGGGGRVQKIDATTGLLSVVAGNGRYPDGVVLDPQNVPATSVAFMPIDCAVDTAGNLYLVDDYAHDIRKVAAGSGLMTTIAGGWFHLTYGDGGPAKDAAFISPAAIAVDAANNLFIADPSDGTIRRIDGGTGIITRVAGTGDTSHSQEMGAALATSITPTSIAVLPDGSLVFADYWNDRIRKLTPQNPASLTISSGDGQTAAVGVDVNVEAVVRDAAGLPVSVFPVTFSVVSGAAQITTSTVLTASTGVATAKVTLGEAVGQVVIQADSAGLGSVIFTINVVPPFINARNPVTGLPMSNPPVTALSPNGLMQISGQGFVVSGGDGIVGDSDLVNGLLPALFKGVCVTVGGDRASLLAVSPRQIVFQVPGSQSSEVAAVSVTINCGTDQEVKFSPLTLPVQNTAPELFYAAHNTDGTALVAAKSLATGHPVAQAQPGDRIMVYLTGLGPTSPATNNGAVVTDNLGVNAVVTIQLGAAMLTPDWVTTPSVFPGSAFIPVIGENAGIYQILFTIPADAPVGNLPINVMTSDGALSPSGTYLTIAPASSGQREIRRFDPRGTHRPNPDRLERRNRH